MRRVLTLYSTSIGKKVVMAITGILLVLFVIAHMVGNLKMYYPVVPGHEPKLDLYGEWLRNMGAPALGHMWALWTARIVLLGAVLLHIHAAWTLRQMSHSARPTGYRKLAHQESNVASRTMRWGGLFLAFFVLFHILNLTTGTIHPDFQQGHVLHNVVTAFSVPWVSAIYVLAMIFLGLHLYHGVWSLLQTLGANHPRYNVWRRWLAAVIAIVVTVGNISFPIAVMAGIVHLP